MIRQAVSWHEHAVAAEPVEELSRQTPQPLLQGYSLNILELY